jgi:HD-GYP domain-containing protein (c-di-GMP phosphodiesterase class II)
MTVRAPETPVTPPPDVASVPALPADAPPALTLPEAAPSAASPFAELQAFLNEVVAVVKADGAIVPAELQAILQRLVVETTGASELFWTAHAATAPAGIDPLAFHQARVAVLAVRVGATLGLQLRQLVDLGTAASLMDAGLWLTGRAEPNSAEYRSHPRRSAELVRRWLPQSEAVVQAVLHHHELEHGQGFPQGLKRDAIHPFAKVLGLMDRYATLTGAWGGAAALRPHDVIRDIVRSKNDEFAPAVIKALLSEISIFPPGTAVRLNTGEYGRVVGVNRNHPLRPRVAVVADGKGHPLATPRVIDLSETPFLYITGPASEPR